MRLKLVAKSPIDDPAEKGWRLLEHGELTIGRSTDCNWPLADPERTLSKVHCRIVKSGAKFLLRDESTNGVTVDGAELVEGQSVTLSNGSSIRLGDFAFVAEITGVEEPDWEDPDPALPLGDENLTVTSIISDVSVGGRTATGIIPGRSGDDWIEAQAAPDPDKTRQPETRDVEIGWNGPPDLRLVQPQLPADWNLSSDVASRSEHMPATNVRVRVAKAAETPPDERPAPAAKPQHDASVLVAAFLSGARLQPVEPADPASFLRDMGGALRGALDRLAALEAASADFFAEHGVERDRAQGDDPLTMARRLDRLIDDQRQLHDGVRTVLDDFSRRFDPRAIEARADAKASGLLSSRLQSIPVLAERAYWAAYRDAYAAGADGGGLRGVFRESIGGREPKRTADGFEELTSDKPQGRGAA